jgi:hypothetical protein
MPTILATGTRRNESVSAPRDARIRERATSRDRLSQLQFSS